MKQKTVQKNKGFTLIETMIAVFILATAISGLLGLISNSLYSARYAKNDIVANYLIQEVTDYVRNDRDTIAFQHYGGGTWDSYINKYLAGGCFTTNGCQIEPAMPGGAITACSTTPTWGTINCAILNYDEQAANNDFYTYQSPAGSIPSNFKRKVVMNINPGVNNPDQLDIIVTIEWKNGTLVRSRTLNTSLLNWQK